MKNKIEFRCEKCNNPQPINEDKSNKNWNVFDCNSKCECGGKYVMCVDGEKIGD